MSARKWREVTKADPCPACGKPDWCAWTREGWLKCERVTEPPAGFYRVSVKDGGGVFKPDDPNWRDGRTPKPRRRGDTTPRKPASGAGSVAVAGDRKPDEGRTFPTAREAVAELERRHGPKSAHWVYTDAEGDPVGLVVRWNTPTGKDVRPVSRKADGSGWVVRKIPDPHPLYRLPDLLATKPGARVYVCEGEKAADAARAIGLVATTSAGGAKRAKGSDWSPAAQRDVVIPPDHDEAGEKYADEVTRLATAEGAKSVRIVRLVELWAGMPEGGDMADFVEHRRAEGADDDTIRAEVEALADRTEPEAVTAEAPVVQAFDARALFPQSAAYARDYFCALGVSSQTPVEMPALLGLAIASATVANVARVFGHGDHVEPAQLWALVLCEPATRKSKVVSELLAPVVAWEKRRAEELAPTIAEATQRRKIDEKRLRTLEENAAKRDDKPASASQTEEAIELAKRIHATPIPTAPVLLASEPTLEALTRQMADNHGRALLASAEADALDIAQGRYSGGKNYGILLKGHAGDAVRAQRVGRPGDTIDHPALAVALCVQPEAVRDVWSDRQAEGRGLLARFAVIHPPDWIGSRDVRPPAVRESVRAVYRGAIDRLLSFEPGDSPVSVGLSAEADTLYYDFQRRTEAALGDGDLSDRKAWGGKLCGLALRIALTLHALGTWALHGQPNDFPTIDAATMRAAIAWADYLAWAERDARERLNESESERDERQLVEWIERRGKDREPGTATVRDVTRGPRRYRDAPDPTAKATEALNALVGKGMGHWETSNPGRPTDRFRLGPRPGDTGDGDETHKSPGNRGGCVAVATATDDDWGEA